MEIFLFFTKLAITNLIEETHPDGLLQGSQSI